MSLGNWQLRRADEKRQLHALRQQALADAPIDLNASTPEPASLDGHRVMARGHWLADRTILLDNRTHQGVSGVHVITPLQLADRQTLVLVLRGWTPTDPADRKRTPLLQTPPGEVRVQGLVETRLAQPIRLGADAPPAPDERLWQHFDYDRYRTWSGLAVPAMIVRQADPGRSGAQDGNSANPVSTPTAVGNPVDGLFRDWVEPGKDVDKHLGYAVQWFSLAALVLGLWLWLGVIRPRRRAAIATDPRRR